MEIQRSFFEAEPYYSSLAVGENVFQLQSRRYIGNKYKLTNWIFSILSRECSGDSFADLFAGTGVVGAAAGRYFGNNYFK